MSHGRSDILGMIHKSTFYLWRTNSRLALWPPLNPDVKGLTPDVCDNQLPVGCHLPKHRATVASSTSKALSTPLCTPNNLSPLFSTKTNIFSNGPRVCSLRHHVSSINTKSAASGNGLTSFWPLATSDLWSLLAVLTLTWISGCMALFFLFNLVSRKPGVLGSLSGDYFPRGQCAATELRSCYWLLPSARIDTYSVLVPKLSSLENNTLSLRTKQKRMMINPQRYFTAREAV